MLFLYEKPVEGPIASFTDYIGLSCSFLLLDYVGRFSRARNSPCCVIPGVMWFGERVSRRRVCSSPSFIQVLRLPLDARVRFWPHCRPYRSLLDLFYELCMLSRRAD